MGPEAFRAELVRRVGRELRRGVRGPSRTFAATTTSAITPQADGEHSAVGFCRPGRAPEGRPALRARAPGPRVRHDARGPPDPPAERPAAVDPERARRRAAGRAAVAQELQPQPDALQARRCRRARARSSAAWPRSTRRGRGRAAEIAAFLDAHVHPERPRRGLPPALRGLLLELRAAPDRRHRHRGRAEEGRRRVRRGDGHPHRRPPRAPTRSSATSWSARSRTGSSTRRCCGSSASTRRRTPTARRSAPSRPGHRAEWWTEQLAPEEAGTASLREAVES